MGKHWHDGFWLYEGYPYMVMVVNGENVDFTNIAQYDYPDETIAPFSTGTWEFGSFVECPDEIKSLSGAEQYNLKMVAMDGKLTVHCVLAEDGKTFVSLSFDGQEAQKAKWVSKDQLMEIASKRESCLTPTTVYKIQPEIQGKLLFLSGPPGSGKSTSGLLLAQNQNYVYYEADCFLNLQNPYLPLDVKEPSVAFPSQPALKGFSLDTVKCATGITKDYQALCDGKEYDKENIKQFYMKMADHVKQEKQRIGGLNWVVAQAVPHRWLRQYIKDIIGPDCIFVVLSMSEETQVKRVQKRYANFDEDMKKFISDLVIGMAKQYDTAGDDEENAVNVYINPEDSEQDVIDKIMSAVQSYL